MKCLLSKLRSPPAHDSCVTAWTLLGPKLRHNTTWPMLTMQLGEFWFEFMDAKVQTSPCRTEAEDEGKKLVLTEGEGTAAQDHNRGPASPTMLSVCKPLEVLHMYTTISGH